MDDVFKVPAHPQIDIENRRNGNMSRIVSRSRPHNRRFQVSVSEVIRLRRGVDNLDLLRRQVRQNGTHRVWSQCQLVECDVGNHDDKLALPRLFKEPHALGLEFVVEASSEYRRIRVDTEGLLHSFYYGSLWTCERCMLRAVAIGKASRTRTARSLTVAARYNAARYKTARYKTARYKTARCSYVPYRVALRPFLGQFSGACKSSGSLVRASPCVWRSCSSVRSSAVERSAPQILAGARSTPVSRAPTRFAPRRSACRRSAPRRLASTRSASYSAAPDRFASIRSAPRITAKDRSGFSLGFSSRHLFQASMSPITSSKCSLSAIRCLLYRSGHQETIPAILVIARYQAHTPETERAIQLRARRISGPHHQLHTPDAGRAQFAERVPYERIGHTAPAIIRMDAERGDLGVALPGRGHRVAGDAPARFGHHEEVPAIAVEFQEVLARPSLGAEAGAFDAHDAREMAQPERNDLDDAGQRALAVERPQSM